MAINLYLARKAGGPLAPGDLREEAVATRWSFWAATAIEPRLAPIFANLMALPPQHRRPEAADAQRAKLTPQFAALDSVLRDGGHIVGKRFTVADLNVAGVFSLLAAAGVRFSDHPALQGWLDACLARPGVGPIAQPFTFTPDFVDAYLRTCG